MRPGESAVAVGLDQLNAEYDPESQGGIPESAGTTGAGEDQPRPASLAFSKRLSGEVLLIDHDGWLLARKLPGEGSGNWSESDILCRAPAAMKNTAEEKKATVSII